MVFRPGIRILPPETNPDEPMKARLLSLCCLAAIPFSLPADRHVCPTLLPTPEAAETAQYPHRRPLNVLSPRAADRIFQLAKETSFRDDRMRLLEAALLERYITASQCVKFLKLADFDDERLAIIRLVGNRIADPENIIDILDQFSFDSDRQRARDILRPRR